MNWLFTLFFRWLDRRKSDVSFEFGPTVAGSDKTVAFATHLTNDGTKIARGVVVRGLLDGDEVYVADPVDIPLEAPAVRVAILLQRPGQADLSKALNDRPIFHRRKFTATAAVGHRVLVAEWPHEDEPDPPTPAEEEREWRAEAQRELLRKDAERRDGDEGRYQYV